jgi:signal transduction histidine kinase
LTLSAKRDSNLPKTDWMISILKRSRAAHKELQVAQRRLQEAQVLAAIGTAATKIVHDMTNPLNAISTTIQLQERYLENKSDRLPDLVAGTVQDLKDETNRVRELIDELRHFSQPLQLKLDPTDLAKLAEEVAHEALFKPTGSASIQFEQHCAGDLPLIMADGEKLRRVVLNLFNNALQAMPDGGTLTFKCYREGNHVCLEIQDTGCGIPKEMKIFEPFTTSKANGWGLGLTIAQQIILAHKGFIRFSSEPGQGTTFTILLPVTTTPT